IGLATAADLVALTRDKRCSRLRERWRWPRSLTFFRGSNLILVEESFEKFVENFVFVFHPASGVVRPHSQLHQRAEECRGLTFKQPHGGQEVNRGYCASVLPLGRPDD